jgi:hypothetical protein
VTAALLGAGTASSQAPSKKTQPENAESAQTQKTLVSRYDYTAELFERAARQGQFRVGDLVWSCKGKRCEARAPSQTLGVSACRALAEEVGKIRRYGRPGKGLSSADLSRCNSRPSTGAATGKRQATTAQHPAAGSIVREPTERPPERSSVPPPAGATAQARPANDLLPGTTVGEDDSMRIRTDTLTITGRGGEAVVVPPFSPMTVRAQVLTITGLGEEAVARPELTPVLIRTRRLTITGLGD